MVNFHKNFILLRILIPIFCGSFIVVACQQLIVYSDLNFTNQIALNSELVAYCSAVEPAQLKACFMGFAKKKNLSNADAENAWALYTSMQHSRSEFCKSGVAVNENIASCSQH